MFLYLLLSISSPFFRIWRQRFEAPSTKSTFQRPKMLSTISGTYTHSLLYILFYTFPSPQNRSRIRQQKSTIGSQKRIGQRTQSTCYAQVLTQFSNCVFLNWDIVQQNSLLSCRFSVPRGFVNAHARALWFVVVLRLDQCVELKSSLQRRFADQNEFVDSRFYLRVQGFRGRSKNCYSLAVRRVHKALQYQYTSRRLKKRDMRSVSALLLTTSSRQSDFQLWIQRIGAGTVEHGISYSKFMHEMATSDIQLNRKVLSEIAVHEPKSFKVSSPHAQMHARNTLNWIFIQALADFAKKRHEDGLRAAL